jgi:hypothetical protein
MAGQAPAEDRLFLSVAAPLLPGGEIGVWGAGLISRHAPVSRGRTSSRTTTVRSGRRPLDHGAYHRNFLRPCDHWRSTIAVSGLKRQAAF